MKTSRPRLCDRRTWQALRNAARFEADFADFERALRFGTLFETTIMTPEQMVVELRLTSARVRDMRQRLSLAFPWAGPTHALLRRHALFPAAKMDWEKWLGQYRALRRRHAEVRQRFEERHLSVTQAWSLPRAAKFLGLEPNALAASQAEKWICGVHRANGHQLVFPAWQFDGKTRSLRRGIAVGLELLRDADGLDEWLRCAFFLTPFAALGGQAAVRVARRSGCDQAPSPPCRSPRPPVTHLTTAPRGAVPLALNARRSSRSPVSFPFFWGANAPGSAVLFRGGNPVPLSPHLFPRRREIGLLHSAKAAGLVPDRDLSRPVTCWVPLCIDPSE